MEGIRTCVDMSSSPGIVALVISSGENPVSGADRIRDARNGAGAVEAGGYSALSGPAPAACRIAKGERL
jgi:hypothetical protein